MSSDLYDIEQELPSQLRQLAGTIGAARLTRARIDRRVAQRATRRRVRRAIGGSAVAALALFAGVGALTLQDTYTGGRVISGAGGMIAPATQPVGPVGTIVAPDPETPTTTLSTVVPVPVDAAPAGKPVGAQTPDPAKNAPAAPERAANSGVSGQGSSIAAASPEPTPIPTTVAASTQVFQCPTWTGPESAATWPARCGVRLGQYVGPTQGGGPSTPASTPASVPSSPPGR